ncbi:MAG: C1 family peptidase [Gemmatimonadaceae bacterium]
MSDAHGVARGRPWAALSSEYLFYRAIQRDGGSPHNGTTIPTVRAALRVDGQPVEEKWPYMEKLPANLKSWRPPDDPGVLYRRASSIVGHLFTDIWNAVEADQAVVATLTLSGAFYRPDSDCVVDSPEPVDPRVRHAVVAIGTGMRGPQKMVLVRNSWGESWGCSGYAWLSEQYAAPRIFSAILIN